MNESIAEKVARVKLGTKDLVSLIDVSDYEEVSKYKWHATFCGPRAYARSWKAGGKEGLFLHQFLLGCKWIDHVNGDTLDNRRSNLRPCTNSQNQANKKVTLARSGFRGVHLERQTQKWFAQIKCEGRTFHLGTYWTKEAAAIAYDLAARKLFGEFAFANVLQWATR